LVTVKDIYVSEQIIKKSKFIGYLISANDIKDVLLSLDKLKKNYKGATHYCYAYIVDNYKKCSDDKEPNKTAGLPILEAMEKNNLNFCLLVVIRYYGGINLGTAGLSRAYKKIALDVIKKADLISIQKGVNLELSFAYDKKKQVESLISPFKLISSAYNEKIVYNLIISKNKFLDIECSLKLLASLNILKESMFYEEKD